MDAPAGSAGDEHEGEGITLLRKYHARVLEKTSPETKQELETKLEAAKTAMTTAEENGDDDDALQAYKEVLQIKKRTKAFPNEEGVNALKGKFEVVLAATRAYKDAEKAYREQLLELEKQLLIAPSPTWVSQPAQNAKVCASCQERPRGVCNLPCKHLVSCAPCTVKWFAQKGATCQQCRNLVTSVKTVTDDDDMTPLAITHQPTFNSNVSTEGGTPLIDFFKCVQLEATDIDEKCQRMIGTIESGQQLEPGPEEEEEDMGFDLFD